MNAKQRMVRLQNEAQLATGQKTFLSTIFEGDDGIYYDAVGDEIFIVEYDGSILSPDLGEIPVYRIDFGFTQQIGAIKDHGFNEFLGPL